MEPEASALAAEAIEGDLAYKSIKALYPKLSLAVTRGQIPERLYAKDLIDEEMMVKVDNQTYTDAAKGRAVLRQLQNSVLIKPSAFLTFVKILKDESVTNLLGTSLEG